MAYELVLDKSNFLELTNDEMVNIDGGSVWNAINATIGTVGIAWTPIIIGAAIATGATPVVAVIAGVAMLGASAKLLYDSVSNMNK